MVTAGKVASRIIGIDPGLNVTGYGVVECRDDGVRLLEAGVIRPTRRPGQNLAERLESLFQELQGVMEEFNPQAMCLEEVYSHAAYPRTSILMGHARGVICLAARLARIPVINFAAKRIKQSVTGNGNASKLQVQRAIQHFFSLARVPHPPDVADALAAALCYVNALRAAGDGRRSARRQGNSPGRTPALHSSVQVGGKDINGRVVGEGSALPRAGGARPYQVTGGTP
jgi:crossover junction endodeoxyribonuclease RuvC